MRRQIVGLLGLALMGACGDPGTGASLRMSLQVAPVDPGTVVFDPANPETGNVPPVAVRIHDGTLHVSGYFETPCRREPVRGSARLTGSTVRIRIWAERVDDNCMTRPDPYTYDGLVHNLDGGTYRVVLEHERDARRRDGVVLDAVLQVP